MNMRVSELQVETQGRGERVSRGEQKSPMDRSESRIDTEAYRTMLAKELLINDAQEDYGKYF